MTSLSKYVSTWLLISIAMVILMIIIGGITRLTDSGLSMVEWRLIYGFLPPISDMEWNRVFQLYKGSPEYIIKNNGMNLSEFKKIFFWEYFHRLWGRLIGFVFIIPFLIFLFFKQIPKLILNKVLIILTLGGIQGFVGWWMVKSGLVNDPSVSQYRLAVHLSNALLILFLLFWTYLDLKEGRSKIKLDFSFFVFLILSTTIIAGAFVAGMDAGLMYNEYPMMGNNIIPENYGEYQFLDPFENPASAQFHHRHLALLTMIFSLIYCFKYYNYSNDVQIKRIALLISSTVCLQFFLGIVTLINMVPVHLGAFHQTGAVILFLAFTASMHRVNLITKTNEI
jgi:cytochrome c oxidase assembly protein subunit 15